MCLCHLFSITTSRVIYSISNFLIQCSLFILSLSLPGCSVFTFPFPFVGPAVIGQPFDSGADTFSPSGGNSNRLILLRRLYLPTLTFTFSLPSGANSIEQWLCLCHCVSYVLDKGPFKYVYLRDCKWLLPPHSLLGRSFSFYLHRILRHERSHPGHKQFINGLATTKRARTKMLNLPLHSTNYKTVMLPQHFTPLYTCTSVQFNFSLLE